MPKAVRTPDLLATRFVKLIDKLFGAEQRSQVWAVERRQKLRQRYSAQVLDALKKLLLEQRSDVVPGSLLGKALTLLV